MRTEIFEKSNKKEKRSFRFDDLLYFQASCKYVEAHHTGGMLDLDDSLISLEREYGDNLMRIHRATLVKRDRPMRMFKADSQSFLKIDGVDNALPISRRYVNRVRRQLGMICECGRAKCEEAA